MFAWGEGPFVLAIFAVALSVPYVIIGPVLAVLVDRIPLKRTLLLTNLGRAAATLGLAVAPNTVFVLVLVFVRAAIDSAFTPARQGAIQATTPPELLARANGVHHAINQTSKIAGPALGGLLLAVMPAQSVFLLNAVLSLIAAALIASIVLPQREVDPGTPPERFFKELPAGVAEIRRNKLLLIALVFSAVAYFAIFLYDALIALLTDEFGFTETVFGFGIAASGAGGVLAAFLAGYVPVRHALLSMVGAAAFSGVVTSALAMAAILAWPLNVWLLYLALGSMGGGAAFMLVPYRTIVQRETPPDRIGRVHASGEAVIVTVMLSAPFIGSAIAETFGTGTAFLGGGLVLLGLAAVAAVRTHGIRAPASRGGTPPSDE